ncbi:unnamed protein product [Mortierella alpina]
MTVLWVFYQVDDFRTANLGSEHSIEDTLSTAVKSQLTKLWRSQAHFGQTVDTLTGAVSEAADGGGHDEERIQTQTEAVADEKLKPHPRVFDVILLNDELDTLEIRLNELESVVDVFFIMEAEYTFSGKPKPLYFKEHEARFRQFRDKIFHITIPPLSEDDKAHYAEVGGWANEMFGRDIGFKIATDVRKPNEGDWIILSDLDEIPKRSFLKTVKAPDADTEIGRQLLEGFPESGGDVFKLGCQFYYYSFEYRHRSDWYGPTLMRYRNPDSPIFTRPESDPYPGLQKIQHIMENNWSDAGSRLRSQSAADTPHFDGQCHHCSWCFANITQVTRKMQSYSHKEHGESIFTDRAWILDHFSQGLNLFDRGGLANAGFIDVDPMNPLAE